MKAASLAAACALALAAPAQAEELRLMTGPQGGIWVPLGGALKNMWEKAVPGVTIQTLPGAGISNVRAVHEGKADIGFGNSISTVDAVISGPIPSPSIRTTCTGRPPRAGVNYSMPTAPRVGNPSGPGNPIVPVVRAAVSHRELHLLESCLRET